MELDSEVRQFLHEFAIHGSVDAVYGVGKQYLKTDIQKAISMFELAAEQGNSYAEYQLGKLYCFGQGVPQNLEVGMEWLRASASHGNEYASALLEKVQNHIHRQIASAVFGLFRGLAGMLQSSANNFIRRRNTIDRKQRQKIEEKKQALGHVPVVMNMTTTRGSPCKQYRRTAPFGIVRRHLTKRNKQLISPKAKIINLALLPIEKAGTTNAPSQPSL